MNIPKPSELAEIWVARAKDPNLNRDVAYGLNQCARELHASLAAHEPPTSDVSTSDKLVGAPVVSTAEAKEALERMQGDPPDRLRVIAALDRLDTLEAERVDLGPLEKLAFEFEVEGDDDMHNIPAAIARTYRDACIRLCAAIEAARGRR